MRVYAENLILRIADYRGVERTRCECEGVRPVSAQWNEPRNILQMEVEVRLIKKF